MPSASAAKPLTTCLLVQERWRLCQLQAGIRRQDSRTCANDHGDPRHLHHSPSTGSRLRPSYSDNDGASARRASCEPTRSKTDHGRIRNRERWRELLDRLAGTVARIQLDFLNPKLRTSIETHCVGGDDANRHDELRPCAPTFEVPLKACIQPSVGGDRHLRNRSHDRRGAGLLP